MGEKALLIMAVAAVLGSANGCVSLENKLLYYPTRCSKDRYEPPPAPVQDIELHTADGIRIHGRWCPHRKARGAVLYCHGNAGNIDGRAGAVRELWQALGESVLIFDYPGYGYSEGQPSEAGCYAAAEAAYDWLTRVQKISPERVLIYGESLGGGVAVDLASRRPHRALVLVRTFTSVTDVAQAQFPLLPVRLLMTSRFDSLGKIGQCTQPVFIAQADGDHLVPFSQGVKLRAACGRTTEFYQLRGLDHNDPLPIEFYAALRRFVETRVAIAPS
jgi:fermentation-respiration switch protein FrsA (DUF1100 family)